ncbi:hypothetical protein RAH42_13115 (plasmid) [Pyramidobacter sp. YE332]|uniref:hypothetical protein n=1 Tax=Pyramidobacter sp. YE332 TaxID=3068894 RepID=UPI00294AE7E9|nr:hypothetical protein [Pyramidobacter sp. YE332]WOL41352.1 hypothetical protein RAH42_13115 [Pyramidobacter sp. YE332]
MITYMDINQVSRHWDRADTHGGKLAENVTQAVARDCLAAAMLRLNDAGYKIVSHIHDEVVIDAPQGPKFPRWRRSWANLFYGLPGCS